MLLKVWAMLGSGFALEAIGLAVLAQFWFCSWLGRCFAAKCSSMSRFGFCSWFGRCLALGFGQVPCAILNKTLPQNVRLSTEWSCLSRCGSEHFWTQGHNLARMGLGSLIPSLSGFRARTLAEYASGGSILVIDGLRART